MPAHERSAAREEFLDFLRRRKLRLTAPRRAIVEAVFGTQEHFTAEQLLAWARRKDKSVSRATVYRTLPLLTESGLLRSMDLGKAYKLYDPNYAEHPHHSHLVCADCERLLEFDRPEVAALAEEIGRELGFAVVSHRLQIVGRCEALRREGGCPRKPARAKRPRASAV
jgi:Fur family ferric uptake transcriptional regulator